MKTLPSRRAPFAAAALVILLGCQAETFGADDHATLAGATISAPAGKQGPGGEVLLTSDAFAELDEDAGLFKSEGFEAAAIRVDATTFRVRLPDGL